VKRVRNDIRDRPIRPAEPRPENRRPVGDGTSPFQKMLNFFQAHDAAPKKRPAASFKKAELDQKEETRTEARKKHQKKGRGGQDSSSDQGSEQEDAERTRAGEDEEATILEDPVEPEASEVMAGGFRYNPALRAAIPVANQIGTEPAAQAAPALAVDLSRAIAAKVGKKSAGELRFHLAGEGLSGLTVRVRLHGKHVELLLWGSDEAALARIAKIAPAIEACLKALGYEMDALSTAKGG
jgi:hypothetical protein